jgi:hypothetical protein
MIPLGVHWQGHAFGSTYSQTGNSNQAQSGWGGWDIVTLGPNPLAIGYGLYKITTDEDEEAHFYYNTVDCNWGPGCSGYNPDGYFQYRADLDKFFYHIRGEQDFDAITNGQVINCWDMLNYGSAQVTTGFVGYWTRSLYVIPSSNNHPLLLWGPYPDNNFDVLYYKIYRLYSYVGGWQYLDQTSSNSYEDANFEYCTAVPPATCPNQRNISYYIKAVNDQFTESSASNTATAYLVGGAPDKIKAKEESFHKPTIFSLNQNYPNPFNPETKINYALPEDVKVQIKVYDMLGTEVAELVNDYKAAGFYETTFDASNLSSGVYIYRIIVLSGEKILYSQSNQMIFLK